MKYLERIQQSQESRTQEQQQHLNEINKLQLESDLLETKRALSEKRQQLERLKSEEGLRITDIVGTLSDIDALERGLKTIEQLKEELF